MPGIHIRPQKDILWLILDREQQNTLTVEMLNQLTQALLKAIERSSRLVVLTGMGDQAFCAGVDSSTTKHREALQEAARHVNAAFAQLHEHEIGTVALVKGCAYEAGFELVLLCDTVIAREDAQFRLPTVDTKVFPSVLSVNLPAIVGQEEATHLLQSRQTLDAQEAFHLGLVHQVLPAQRFLQDTQELLLILSTVS
jgi:enoyl-CoA hydratase/carnithine racemase